jgi:hypothetical protein
MGSATVVTTMLGFKAVAIPSMISTANAALMNDASNLTYRQTRNEPSEPIG